MPMTIRIDDDLAERIGALAAGVGLSVDPFVERILVRLADPGFVIQDDNSSPEPRLVAARLASQPLQVYDEETWRTLTRQGRP